MLTNYVTGFLQEITRASGVRCQVVQEYGRGEFYRAFDSIFVLILAVIWHSGWKYHKRFTRIVSRRSARVFKYHVTTSSVSFSTFNVFIYFKALDERFYFSPFEI